LGKIVLAMGVPHAPQLVTPPERWPEIYQLVMCAARSHRKEVEQETLEDNKDQLKRVQKSFAMFRDAVKEAKPNALMALTDDHFDNFFLDDYPQFSIYLGSKVDGTTVWLEGKKFEYDCDADLEKKILTQSIPAGFDLSFSEEIHMEYGHVIPLSYVLPDSSVPLVPIYTNAYATPQPSPERCYSLGKFLAEVIEKYTPPNFRVALLASGGMSHYPGEPLAGEVDTTFDKKMLEWIKAGRGEEFARLTSKNIDETGNTEMRSWIVMLGAIGNKKPVYTDYVLSWRAIIGLGFAMWSS
jgi:aromatic ring-opening dioxygenase LigB subunit